ncbi:hypothetical protein B0J17DRAFT_673429 [Rhizoctonia solani]|nr:hypothetical protein B0J17DRAFT_673429 [Rhizoctonia solani]
MEKFQHRRFITSHIQTIYLAILRHFNYPNLHILRYSVLSVFLLVLTYRSSFFIHLIRMYCTSTGCFRIGAIPIVMYYFTQSPLLGFRI